MDTWNKQNLEENRRRALEYYHTNREEINDKRQRAYTLQRLPVLLRKAEKDMKARQQRLEKVARKIFSRRTPEEKQIARALRRRFNKGMSQHRKSDYILKLCGTTLAGVKKHLESLFKLGMTWGNYGWDGWHIDHIKPCAEFDLTDPAQQRICFHYTNLQPLWKDENFEKGANILSSQPASSIPLFSGMG